MNFDLVTNIIIGIVVTVAIIIAIREVILWYYKINLGIKLLEEIRDELKKLNGHSVETQKENTPEEKSYLELLKQGKVNPKE